MTPIRVSGKKFPKAPRLGRGSAHTAIAHAGRTIPTGWEAVPPIFAGNTHVEPE